MRTTINIEAGLLRNAKKVAAERGLTLTRVIEEALRDAFSQQSPARDFDLQLPVVSGRRAPEVDIAARGALYELMDERPERA